MPDELSRVLVAQEDVITRGQALRFLSAKALRHRVESGRWRLAHRAVFVAQTGPLTRRQREWVAVCWRPVAAASRSVPGF